MARARDTVIDRFLNHVHQQAGRPALWYRRDDDFVPISWTSYGEKVRHFAGALLGQGYEPGDVVAIAGNNSPEWVIAALGAMMVRGAATGIYQTLTPEKFAYVAEHSEAKVLVLEDLEQWEKVTALDDDALPDVQRYVLMNDSEKVDHEQVVSFEDFLEEGEEHLGAVDERFEDLADDDLAVLIYTSGTTGPPKGVMLDHKNLSFTAARAIELAGNVNPDDCVVSYLPLSHIAEQMFTIHLAISAGYPVWFAQDISEVKDTLVAARPTIFLGVPRVWEKFKAALEGKLSEATGIKAKLSSWARDVGLRGGYEFLEKGEVGGMLGMQYKLADSLVFSKIADGIGFDRMRVAVSGAAPIGLDVLEFFLSCGIPIYEVYGQSEDCGPTAFNAPRPGGTKLGTVGQPFPGIKVEIADDPEFPEGEGEILVKGDNVFKGYFKNPEATEETLIDGWLHSGDVGKFDEDGFLMITDRKKDLIITAGGKNVAPQNIEKKLKKIDGISQAVVVGDRYKFLSALMTLDPERAPALASEHGWPTDPEELVEHEEFRDYIQKGVDKANAELSSYETMKRFALIPREFLQEEGELTPTQKIKRRVINEHFADEIEGIYADVD